MISQILFLSFLQFIGLFFSSYFRAFVPASFLSVTSFIWGAAVWFFGAVILFAFNIEYTLSNMGILLAVFSLALLLIDRRKNGLLFEKKFIIWSLTSLFFGFLLITILVNNNFSILSYDSVRFIQLSQQIAWNGGIQNSFQLLTSWGLFLPVLLSSSFLIGNNVFTALLPCFAMSLFFTVTWFSFYGYKLITQHTKMAWSIVWLPAALLFSSYFVLFESVYFHNSLLAACYFTIAVITIWIAITENKPQWIVCSILALTVFSFMRIETLLYTYTLIAVILSFRQLRTSLNKNLILALCSTFIFFHILLLLFTPDGGILGHKSIAILIFLSTTVGILTVLSKFTLISKLLDKSILIIITILVLANIIFLYTKPVHVLQNVLALNNNMTRLGMWQWLWSCLAGLLLFTAFLPKFKNQNILLFISTSFFLILLACGFARIKPFRLGWGDSANRIITIIAPIVTIYVFYKMYVVVYYLRSKIEIKRNLKVISACRYVVAGLVFAAVALFLVLPDNIFPQGKIIQAPKVISNIPEYKYSIEGLLKNSEPRITTVLMQKYPYDLVVEFPKNIKADYLLITNLSSRYLIKDFAVLVGDTNKQFKIMFDSRQSDPTKMITIDNENTLVALNSKKYFKFFKLDIRKTKPVKGVAICRLQLLRF